MSLWLYKYKFIDEDKNIEQVYCTYNDMVSSLGLITEKPLISYDYETLVATKTYTKGKSDIDEANKK